MRSSTRVADENIRVLFIERDPAVAEMYKLKLELDGYIVTIVTPGEDLATAASATRPDLVFVDTQSEAEGGAVTLRALRSLPATRDVPAIILSNRHAGERTTAAFGVDVRDYVVEADLAFTALSRNVDEWADGARRAKA